MLTVTAPAAAALALVMVMLPSKYRRLPLSFLFLLLQQLMQWHNMIVRRILARLTEAEIDDGFIIVVLGGGVGVGGSSVDSACG